MTEDYDGYYRQTVNDGYMQDLTRRVDVLEKELTDAKNLIAQLVNAEKAEPNADA